MRRNAQNDRLDSESAGIGLEDSLPGGVDEASLASDWSVPWSDLMMTMFVLFVVLYVFQASERKILPGLAPAQAVEEPMATEAILEQSMQAVEETDLSNIDVVLQADQSVKLSVKGATVFELGSAELRPQTRSFLDRLARVLRRNDRRVRVAGHTDTFPISNESYPTNWELSAARATMVVRYLVERGDLDPGRFEVEAHSMYHPAFPNDTPENKANNRRVEIIVLPEES